MMTKNLFNVVSPAICRIADCVFWLPYCQGAHMKDGILRQDMSKGQLLIVEAEDSLGHIYPAAVSFCFSESTDNFLILFHTLARNGLDLDTQGFLLMSDRGRAGLKAAEQHLSRASLRFCCEHILRNVAGKIKRKLKEREKMLTREYFRASTPMKSETAKEELKSEFPSAAAEYILKLDVGKIVTATFVAKKVPTHGRINNNSVESEKARQCVARKLPTIVETLNEILLNLATLIGRRQLEAMDITKHAAGSIILPEILTKVHPFVAASSSYVVVFVGTGTYRVSLGSTNCSSFSDQWEVDTHLKRCTCGLWQDMLYPCQHAVAVKVLGIPRIVDTEYEEQWFDEMFRVTNYRKAFEVPLSVPILNDLTRDAPSMTRPTALSRAGPGRPKEEKRMKSDGEF